MEIEVPLKISVLETPGEGGRELRIDFCDQFRAQAPVGGPPGEPGQSL
jgi:hypothetical protein